jgi:membrane protein
VVVHVAAPALADADQSGQSVLDDGARVPAGTSRRLPDGELRFRRPNGQLVPDVPRVVDPGRHMMCRRTNEVMSETSPWKLGGLSVRELAGRVWREFWEHELLDRAAALAYYFLFALFPALLFLTALLGLLPGPALMDQLMGYVVRVMPPEAAAVVRRTLSQIVSGAGSGLLSVGAVAALWSGSSGMASAMTALNIVYGVSDHRPWWQRRLLAVTLTVGFSLFVLLALVLMVFGGHIGSVAAGWLGLGDVFTVLWNVVSILLAVVLALVGIALVYYFAPAAEQDWRWLTPGSTVCLVFWLAISLVLRVYVERVTDYNATYGSIGGVILLVLWLYLSSVVLLLGAEINSEIEHAAAERGEPSAKAEGQRRAA